MYDLSTLTTPTARPVIATIVGEHGLGKTTLAAMFPAPVAIRTEDGFGVEHSNVMLFPEVCTTAGAVWQQLDAIEKGEHPFRTVIIDSISELNNMIEHEIITNDSKAKNIVQACGGFGAGLAEAAERHRQIREKATALVARGMNVVFICHAETETIDPPDAEAYTRYSVRLGKKAIPHYTDNVDLVAFVKLQRFVSGGDKEKGKAAKATGTGKRIITCYPTPNHISKNRFGIETDLVFERGVNPFVEYIPQLKAEA